jgi:hypothetical protein
VSLGDRQGSYTSLAGTYVRGRYIQPASLLSAFNPQRILPAGGVAAPGIGADPAITGPMYVFVTTPDINLGVATLDQTQDAYAGAGNLPLNLANSPQLSSLLELANSSFGPVETAVLGLGSPMAPNALAQLLTGGAGFIKLLTNMCKGFSPTDVTMDVTQMGEAWDGAKMQLPKSTLNSRQDGTLTLEYEEWSGAPVTLLHKIWVDYMDAVTRGYLAPKLSANYLSQRVLDYAVSIYAFQLLPDATTIEWGGRWTGCFPAGAPHSAWAASSAPSHSPITVSVPYSYQFYEPMDPAIFAEFNYAATDPTLDNGLLGAGASVSITGGALGGGNPNRVLLPNRNAYYLIFDDTASQIQTPGF